MRKIFFCMCVLVMVALSSCGLSEKGFADEDEYGEITITVQPYYKLDANLKLLISEYEESHENVHFEILPNIEWGQMDIAMARTYSDISRGAGADIIMMTDAELENFADKGCLRDLTNIFDDTDKDALLKNVIEYGVVDGKKYLLPLNTNITSMLVNRKYCPSGSLTISEALDIIEKRELEGAPFEYLFVSSRGIESSLDIFLSCIDESEFVDWDKKKCSFDSELFKRLLNTCKKYDDFGTYASVDFDDIISFDMLKEDKVFGQYQSTYSLFSYSSMQTVLNNDYVDVGLPSDKRNGKKMTFASAIGVNRNTKHFKAIVEFLNYVYSYEARQKLHSDELRTDIYNGRVEKDNGTGKYGIRTNEGEFVLLDVKQDGSTYIDEYFEFLNSFSLSDSGSSVIRDIIYEEYAPFFAGEKTVEEVVDIIQSRISLYLMER